MASLKVLPLGDALAFLLLHDAKHAQHVGVDLSLKSQNPKKAAAEVVHDVPAYLTVTTTSVDPLAQTITVTAPEVGRKFTHEGPFSYPPYIPFPLQDCTDREGTLYLRGTIPDLGYSGFNAQQYPPYPLLDSNSGLQATGRVVIDFWNDFRISAVFKTNEENYVSGGSGDWSLFVGP